jgi:hypothetical protein
MDLMEKIPQKYRISYQIILKRLILQKINKNLLFVHKN